MARYRPQNYGDVRDLLGMLVLALPDSFPQPTERNMENSFEDLFGALDALAGSSRNVEVRALISKVKEMSEQSHELFKRGENKQGRHLLVQADGMFGDLKRLRKKS